MPESKVLPSFVIYINNSRLAPKREGDIHQIDVIQKLNSPSQFILKVFDPSGEWTGDDNYSIGSQVKIMMGYKDSLETVIIGEVTSIALRCQREGPKIVNINGQCKIHRFKRTRTKNYYFEKTINNIITELCEGAGLKSEIENLQLEHKFLHQSEINDFEFLLDIAEKTDCYFYIQEDTFYFNRLIRNQNETVVLEQGKTLISFSQSADVTNLIPNVYVQCFDNFIQETIAIEVDSDKIKSLGGQIVKDNWQEARLSITIGQNIDTNRAEQFAIDALTRNNRTYFKGSGSCEGNPLIRAGSIIRIEGVGEKFSAKYLVTSTHHILNPNTGYETHFKLTSNLASSSPQTPPAKSKLIDRPLASVAKEILPTPKDVALTMNNGEILSNTCFLKERLRLAEGIIDKIRQFVDTLEEPRRKAQQSIADAKAKAAEVIEKAQKRIDEATSEVEEAVKVVEEAKVKIEEAKARVESKIEEAKAKAQAQVEKYKGKYQEIKSQAEEFKSSTEAKIEETKQRVAGLEGEAKNRAEAKLEELKTKAEAKISKMDSRLEKYDIKISDAETMMNEAVEKIKTKAKEKLDKVQAQIDEVQAKLDETKQKIEDIKQKILNARQQIEEEASSIKSEIENTVIEARNEIASNIFDIDKCEDITREAKNKLIAQVKEAVPRIRAIIEGIINDIRATIDNIFLYISDKFKEIKLFLQELKEKFKSLFPGAKKLKWFKDGEEVTGAMVDEEVLISAEVEDIPEGKSVLITIWEYDEDNNHDEIEKKNVTVTEGKVEWPWTVVYTEDEDDTNSEEEKSEKGYTLPEYFYVISSEEFELEEESEVLELSDWREIEFLDENDEPMSGERYVLYDEDDMKIDSGNLDDKGFIRIEGIHVKRCFVLFPDIVEEENLDDPEEETSNEE
ncbi:MAG: hypothetical protein JXR70_04845 [Spirochaetales bacterium]|nr:hypothetical protein [Spirochaetales bacterium]